MKNTPYARSILTSLVVVALVTLFAPGLAGADAIAELTFVKGSVDRLRVGEERAGPAKKGDGLDVGDIIRTKSESRAQITFTDGSRINLAQNSRVRIKVFSYEAKSKKRKSMLQIFRGKLRAMESRFFGGSDSTFEVETPTAVAAVRGTDFFAVVNAFPLSSDTIVLDGSVGARNVMEEVEGEVLLGQGEAATVGYGKTPERRPVTLMEIKQLIMETAAGGDEAKDIEKYKNILDKDDSSEDPFMSPGEKIVPPVTPPITETETEIFNVPVEIRIGFP